jgi:hypothetical protein
MWTTPVIMQFYRLCEFFLILSKKYKKNLGSPHTLWTLEFCCTKPWQLASFLLFKKVANCRAVSAFIMIFEHIFKKILMHLQDANIKGKIRNIFKHEVPF